MRMRTARQQLGRGQVREPRSFRRLKARLFAQAHGEFRPPAQLPVPRCGWLLSGRSARACASVGLAHAHLCRRPARARAPQRWRRRRFLSRGLRAAVGFEASSVTEGRGGSGGAATQSSEPVARFCFRRPARSPPGSQGGGSGCSRLRPRPSRSLGLECGEAPAEGAAQAAG